MRLKDYAIKPLGAVFRLYHLRSSFEAEMDQNAIDFLIDGLRHNGKCGNENQQEMFDVLEETGLLEKGDFVELDIRPATELLKVEVELTNSCQIRCKHCFVSHSTSFVSGENLRKFAREAYENGAVSFSFNGGEATLHPDFAELLKYVGDLGLRPRLFTNGITADKKNADLWRSYGLSRAIVSLETFKGFHDWLRGDGTWDKTLAGIKNLLSVGVEVLVNSVVTEKNLFLMPDFTKFVLDEIGVTGIEYGVVSPFGAAEKHWSELFLAPENFPKVFNNSDKRVSMNSGCGPLNCKAGVNQLFMNPDGKIFPCHFLAFHKYELGDISKNSFSEYYGPKNIVGKGLWEFPHDKLDECQSCLMNNVCGGGCRGRAFQFSGIFSPDPISCTRFLGKPLPESKNS